MASDNGPMEMLVPFIACRSQDGPFDDDSFVAGWSMGQLWAALSLRPLIHYATVNAALVDQADLIAMHYGLSMEVEPSDDEWVCLIFRAAAGTDEGVAAASTDEGEQP